MSAETMSVETKATPEITRAAERYLEQYGDPLVMNTYLKVTILVLAGVCVSLAALRAAAPEVDSASIEQQVKAIRTALGRVRTIKTKLTELGACSDVIDEQADELREEIKEALCSIEDSMRAANCKNPPLGSVTLAAEAAATN